MTLSALCISYRLDQNSQKREITQELSLPLVVEQKTPSQNAVIALSSAMSQQELFDAIPEEFDTPSARSDIAQEWPSSDYSWSNYKTPNKTWPANPEMGAGEHYPGIDKKADSEKCYTQGISGPASPVNFDFPVKDSRITSYFGWRKSFGRIHYGIDFSGSKKTPIYAAARGTVTKWTSKNCGSFGYAVEIHHGNEFSTLYAHMSKLSVKPGDHVEQGDLIGYMGSTGNVTGVHLHFEIRKSAIPYNPFLGYLMHPEN